MSGAPKPVQPLLPAQAAAADPRAHAWVAASAGTGKTQVLSARVLRLLLAGVAPDAILCLTFTKLAAAEMQDRVMRTLAGWATAEDPTADLAALGAPTDLATRTRARRLFARVLEAPRGIAIQTIHAFAQSLIASFPVEAGVAPGFAVLDERDGAALRRRLLADAIERAAPDDPFLADLEVIARDGGEARLNDIVRGLVPYGELLSSRPAEAMLPLVRRALGLPVDGEAEAALRLAHGRLDRQGLTRLAAALGRCSGVNALKLADGLAAWLALREPHLGHEAFARLFLTQKGEPKQGKTLVPKEADAADPSLRPFCEGLCAELVAIAEEQALYAIADHAARALRIGQRLGRDWAAAKARMGVVDYDDMIAAARRLLGSAGAADWVRFKLDSRIDHVLVDEAQDTNPGQWDIVIALVEEFFAGAGAREVPDLGRSLFVVGDYKQSIYRFQGADPRYYVDKGEDLALRAGDARQDWRNVPLATNFRSVPAILRVVDAVIADIGHSVFARDGQVPAHVAHRQGEGAVLLWPPLLPEVDEDDPDAEAPDIPAEVQLARRIAATIRDWLDPADPLILGARGRVAVPQDILVLVRERGRLSGALVAALHDAGVPVAGVDRLRLAEPLAVADLLALVRFVSQPADDLTLAALLVSPFGGLDHDQLLGLAHDRPGTLWQAVQGSAEPAVVAARDWLAEVLGFADLASPHQFFERVLSGRLGGRRRLLARLGEEARDAIDAVLDQALAYEARHAPTLQGFLAWVEADDLIIKRDPEAPLDAVRLMTVHGAKGLQAPIVILADACLPPKSDGGPVPVDVGGDTVPIFVPGGLPVSGPLDAVMTERDHEAEREHCRLLYVALTRAEDLLCIGGVAPAKGGLHEGSWHARVAAALDTLEVVEQDRPHWPGTLVYRTGAVKPLMPTEIVPASGRSLLPDWATTPAPQEARPPRPLSPSALAGDTVAAPPPGPGAQAAAARGSALHRLFERLPALPASQRRRVGEAWCAAAGHEPALVDEVLRVLDDPAFAAVFADGALTEAPVAAVVGNQVIAGTVDRLLVTDSEILVVDFKTGRRVPDSAAAADVFHLRQMAAYAAALAQVFPARSVRAALLYTAGPRLVEIPPSLLALHHPQAELALNPVTAATIVPN